MAVVNLVQCRGAHVLPTADRELMRSAMQFPSHPLSAANHTVTTAAKLALTAGAQVLMVSAVSGRGVYAITGDPADDDITVGAGFFVPLLSVVGLPVGRDSAGDLHTRLLVIEAA